jgi:hypothetical protein
MTTAAPAPTIEPIFAIPFSVVPIAGAPDLNPVLASLFSARATEEYREPAARRDPLCFRGREDLFEWPHEAVGQLRREMLDGACTAVLAASTYTDAEFDALRLQARARFVIVRPDGCLPAATVPMTSWYAVYCVAAPPSPPPARPDSGALRLYAIRHGTMFMDAANWNLRAPYGGAHYLWRPVPGQMAVFPASILHEVALNRTQSDLVLVLTRLRFAHPPQPAQPSP